MKLLRGVMAALGLATLPALAGADPAITDQAAAKQVLGRHALTLQWLGDGTLRTAGTATVAAQDGTWRLSGRQEAKEGILVLDGEVVAIDRTSFTFQGKVTTRALGNNNDQDCAREGRYVFLRRPGKRYWRMQPILNPCDPVADYIDIYLR